MYDGIQIYIMYCESFTWKEDKICSLKAKDVGLLLNQRWENLSWKYKVGQNITPKEVY